MTPQQRHALVRNNLVAYLLGGGLMVLIHEVVHWLVGAALGYRSTMFSYGVTQQPDPGGWHAAITALSADIASLVRVIHETPDGSLVMPRGLLPRPFNIAALLFPFVGSFRLGVFPGNDSGADGKDDSR